MKMYLEPSQTSKMMPFVKIVNGFMALNISIKALSEMFDWVVKMPQKASKKLL